jgi:hypothetical protein
MVRVYATVTNAMKHKLDLVAQDQGVPRASVIKQILRSALK